MNSIQRQASLRVAKTLLLITAVVLGLILLVNTLGLQMMGLLLVLGVMLFMIKMMYDVEVDRIDLEQRLKKHVDKTEV